MRTIPEYLSAMVVDQQQKSGRRNALLLLLPIKRAKPEFPLSVVQGKLGHVAEPKLRIECAPTKHK